MTAIVPATFSQVARTPNWPDLSRRIALWSLIGISSRPTGHPPKRNHESRLEAIRAQVLVADVAVNLEAPAVPQFDHAVRRPIAFVVGHHQFRDLAAGQLRRLNLFGLRLLEPADPAL